MYKKYGRDIFSDIRKQHNIMVLVGNGFDLALLNKYNIGPMRGKTTSYRDFFEYVAYYRLANDDNPLFKRMKDDRRAKKANWSDFELTIGELVEDSSVSLSKLERSVDEFQAYFTRFLNEIVDANVLLEINADAQQKKFANQSFSKFLKDLDCSCDITFPKNTSHYDLFNFLFVNFNYTSLLDNYLYMDKNQFDPHCWTNADRNFSFYPTTCEWTSGETVWSSYFVYNIVHPHGVQDIPRSILFGIDIPDYNKGRSNEKRLIKSYWSRYDVNYSSYFDETELFIIYGLSLSKTDGWWYDKIYDALLKNESELIIYMYGDIEECTIKDLFISACVRHNEYDDEEIKIIKNKIYVVTFKENDTYFLGLEEKKRK